MKYEDVYKRSFALTPWAYENCFGLLRVISLNRIECPRQYRLKHREVSPLDDLKLWKAVYGENSTYRAFILFTNSPTKSQCSLEQGFSRFSSNLSQKVKHVEGLLVVYFLENIHKRYTDVCYFVSSNIRLHILSIVTTFIISRYWKNIYYIKDPFSQITFWNVVSSTLCQPVF